MAWELVGRDPWSWRAPATWSRSGTGVALLGPAGVGKSRLLREVVDLVTETTRPTVQVAATVATRSIPFAPFAAVVPTAPAWDRLEVFREALAGLRSRMGPGGLLLAVDDAHHLDAGSLALLTAVAREDGMTVCLTARTAEPLDADLAALWTDGVMQRIDLEALDARVGARCSTPRWGPTSRPSARSCGGCQPGTRWCCTSSSRAQPVAPSTGELMGSGARPRT
jgi:predicted ATPase